MGTTFKTYMGQCNKQAPKWAQIWRLMLSFLIKGFGVNSMHVNQRQTKSLCIQHQNFLFNHIHEIYIFCRLQTVKSAALWPN